jgi:hypothetical protein
MSTPQQIEAAIKKVQDQTSFIKLLLKETLNWQIPEGIENIEDMSYIWPADDLRAEGLDGKVVDGKVLQIQPFQQDQQWGIFLLEFKNADAFVKGRGLTGPLRKVLRGLVRKKRQEANRPAWDRENLLFICTYNYEHYCFAYFKAAKDTKFAPLSTFGWNKGDTAIHTLCEYNLCNLVWSDDPQQPQWRTAFDLEKVTKGFFSQIAKLFTELVGGSRKIGSKSFEVKTGSLGFPSPDDTKRKEFAVRLIGRLVFCWFLKKKRSKQDVTLLPEELLSTEALNKNKGYYHNVLEPLFFEVLNTPMDGRDKRFTQKPWATIPFLNGGLFTPHEDDYYPDHEQQRAQFRNMLSVPDDWLRDLLNVFGSYNFTIDENTPVDVELAIEPEMLGRIFENLLAEINPETGETARKATASYYTPRPIVEYMVDESLKQYLLTKTDLPEERISPLLSYSDEQTDLTETQKDSIIAALHEIRVIDPACGSGAFPMGILQKILLILRKLDPDSKKWLGRILSRIDDATFKKDLERKLKRESLEYVHKLGIIRDAIYGVDIQPIAVEISKLRGFLSLIVDETIDDTQPNRGVEPLPNLEFKFVCANTLIDLGGDMLLTAEAAKKITELKQVREEYLNSYGKEKKDLENKFLTIRSELSHLALNWQKGSEKALNLAQWNPFAYESCPWFDCEWMFGIKDGFDIAIANPPYGFRDVLQAEEKKFFRTVMKIDFPSGNVAELFTIISLAKCVRPSAILTFIIPKKSLYGESWANVRRMWLNNSILFLMDASQAFESVLLEQVAFGILKRTSPPGGKITIGALDSPNNVVHVFGRFRVGEIFTPDMRNAQIYRGLYPESLLNKIVQEATPDTSLLLRVEIGISNITQYLTFEPKDNYPSVKGIDIVRYGLKSRVRYLKGIIASQYVDRYKNPKLVAQEIVAHIQNPIPHTQITIFYDEEGRLLNDTCVEINPLDNRLQSKFLLAYLQSTFCNWYAYNFIYNRAIRTMHFIGYYVTQIPIPKSVLNRPELQEPIVAVVEKIIASKSIDASRDTSALERQIDQMVYALYGLTADEIAIVEGHSKSD